MSLHHLAGCHGAPAYALGLALALVLAAFLTPARWWRRPTVRGLAILGGGTWAFGTLLLHFAGAVPAGGAVDTAGMQADVPVQQVAANPVANQPANLPMAGQRYRVHRDLNVRQAAGVGAARQAVVPAGAYVTPTGEHEGDWWRIRYGAAGSTAVGWSSSLWLRRAAEQ